MFLEDEQVGLAVAWVGAQIGHGVVPGTAGMEPGLALVGVLEGLYLLNRLGWTHVRFQLSQQLQLSQGLSRGKVLDEHCHTADHE